MGLLRQVIHQNTALDTGNLTRKPAPRRSSRQVCVWGVCHQYNTPRDASRFAVPSEYVPAETFRRYQACFLCWSIAAAPSGVTLALF
jgi:hypothetical protein